MNPQNSNRNAVYLWSGAGILAVALLLARAIWPEYLWLTIVVAIALIADLGALVQQNRQALKSRSVAYGVNSIVTTVLVIGIIAVLNFIVSRYPFKADLTKNKVHSVSDQTIKLVKGLQKPVKATFFAKGMQREQFRTLLDNYKSLSTKFELEYVDPDREPTRAKSAGVKKYGTLHMAVGPRESNVDDVTEEKVTNALIKLLKDKSPTLCAITGHGEKSFSSQAADGYQAMKQGLTDQAYDVKDVNIVQENKIPETCDAVAILGPTKSFFAPEVKAVKDYLAQGGRLLLAADINLKGSEFSPEILGVLEDWHLKVVSALIVDPLSRMLGVDASVPIVATYSKESPITKDFQTQSYFPFARPIDITPGAPPEMHVIWLGQTTPKSFGVTNMKEVASGQVRFTAGKDRQGPLTVSASVDGKLKDSKATRATRIIVFGTSNFATNQYSRFGANSDLFLNSVAWLVEDESLISIRAKDEGPGKVELSQKQGTFIFLLTVILIPLAISVGGIVIWILRRRL